MTLVKICGIQDKDTAVAAAAAGADYLGLVFAPSRRRISLAAASEIAAAVRKLADPPRIAGVFVNQPRAEVAAIARACPLDLIQLSGEEDWNYCAALPLPLIKALHVSQSTQSAEIQARIAAGRKALSADLIFLLDTRLPELFGGTGQKFDWGRFAGAIGQPRVLVAGGLSEANVASLVSEFGPWGVDVSSGVERAGKKDPARISAFIRRARHPGQEI